MAPELFRVEHIDEWPPARPGGMTVWIIRGETVEASPRRLTLKTVDAWKASHFDRAKATQRLVWVRWRMWNDDYWVNTVSPDTSAFQQDEAV